LGFFDGYGWNYSALEDVLRDDGLMKAKHPFKLIWRDAKPFDPDWLSSFGTIVEIIQSVIGIELVLE
jgi:RNAse (barnase) inhibitor barstar